jgi:alkylation response protein AidB-like acyl-CoA dehydrogenase
VLSGGQLCGKAMMAFDAIGADFVLLAIDEDRLAVVRADAAGLEANHLTTVDTTRCTAELLFQDVTPEAIFDDAGAAVSRMLDAGRIALAADCLGACESMIEQSVAYAGERKQFDRLIGSFQAVKHMCAEMIAELEPARSLLWYAAHSFDALPDETPLMACHALAHCSEMVQADRLRPPSARRPRVVAKPRGGAPRLRRGVLTARAAEGDPT